MATKRQAVNVSVPPELVKQFDEAVAKSGIKRSWVLQGCMKAYIRLIEKADNRPIHALEFKGFDSDDRPPGDWEAFKKLRIIPSRRELKVAELNPDYGKKK